MLSSTAFDRALGRQMDTRRRIAAIIPNDDAVESSPSFEDNAAPTIRPPTLVEALVPDPAEPTARELASLAPWYCRWFKCWARRSERYSLRCPVLLRCEDWVQLVKVYSENISTGGVFLQMNDPPPIDTRVVLQISLPNGNALALSTRVAHRITSEHAKQTGWATGMGVEFVDMTDEQRHAIGSLVEVARATPYAG